MLLRLLSKELQKWFPSRGGEEPRNTRNTQNKADKSGGRHGPDRGKNKRCAERRGKAWKDVERRGRYGMKKPREGARPTERAGGLKKT